MSSFKKLSALALLVSIATGSQAFAKKKAQDFTAQSWCDIDDSTRLSAIIKYDFKKGYDDKSGSYDFKFIFPGEKLGFEDIRNDRHWSKENGYGVGLKVSHVKLTKDNSSTYNKALERISRVPYFRRLNISDVKDVLVINSSSDKSEKVLVGCQLFKDQLTDITIRPHAEKDLYVDSTLIGSLVNNVKFPLKENSVDLIELQSKNWCNITRTSEVYLLNVLTFSNNRLAQSHRPLFLNKVYPDLYKPEDLEKFQQDINYVNVTMNERLIRSDAHKLIVSDSFKYPQINKSGEFAINNYLDKDGKAVLVMDYGVSSSLNVGNLYTDCNDFSGKNGIGSLESYIGKMIEYQK